MLKTGHINITFVVFFWIIFHLAIDEAYDNYNKPGVKDCAAVKLQQAKLVPIPESKNNESAVEHEEPLMFQNEESMDSMHTKSSMNLRSSKKT